MTVQNIGIQPKEIFLQKTFKKICTGLKFALPLHPQTERNGTLKDAH